MSAKLKTSATAHVVIRSGLCALLTVVLVGLAWITARGHTQVDAGVVYGTPVELQPARTAVRGLGVNVDLTQLVDAQGQPTGAYTIDDALEDIGRAGLSWVRQPFPWAQIESAPGRFDWSRWDHVVSACTRHGIALVALLETSPVWARAATDRDYPNSPPVSLSAFGDFAAELAARYGPSLSAYQLWDAPNVQPNWGSGLVNPTEYMRLLREGSLRIRALHPAATIVLAGLAPTTESGPLNLSEALFLDALYRAGAAPYFDVVAAKPYGFWSGADDRRLDGTVLNFSRLALLRDVQQRYDDAAKPVWAVEMGWNALPTGWQGNASPWGTDDETLQSTRTIAALDRARSEWPWLTAIGFARLLPPADATDPAAGFALLDRSGQPRQLYNALVERAGAAPVAYPGFHAPDDPAITYRGGWRVSPTAADIGAEGDSATIAFYGTRIDLKVRRGEFWGLFYVTVDGEAANGLPRDGTGSSYLLLHDPLEQEAVVTVASGLADGTHEVVLTAHGGWDQWPLLGFTVSRAPDTAGRAGLGMWFLVLGIIAAGVTLYNAALLPWESWWPALLSAFNAGGDAAQAAALAVLAAGCYFSPNGYVALALLAAITLLICLRPALGLALVTFCIPFFLIVKNLQGRAINLLELALLVTVAGCVVHGAMQSVVAIRRKLNAGRSRSEIWQDYRAACSLHLGRVQQLDLTMVLLVLAGVVSVVVAENFGVANRELRVVILEPVLFYFLLRLSVVKRRDVWLLLDALVLASTVLALIGLYQYVFTTDIITAEGVRRIRAVYASPNNLSLFLGRVAVLLATLLLALPWSRRRIVYVLVFVPVAVCLYLTFSRGTWFVGLPLAVLFLMIVRRGRMLWIGLIALAGLVLGVIPLAATERFAEMLNLREGTSFLRIKLWQGTVQMIREHPLFGVGLDNFLYQYRTRYLLPEAWQEPNLSHPHNVILDYWTRLGVLGLVVLVWQQWCTFKLGLRIYRLLPDAEDRALVLALLTGMVYALAHGMIDNSFFLVDLSFLLALTLGLIVTLSCDMPPAAGGDRLGAAVK